MRYEWLDDYLMQKRAVTKDLQPVWNWIRYIITTIIAFIALIRTF